MIKTIAKLFARLAGTSDGAAPGRNRINTGPRSEATEFSVAVLGDKTRCDLLRSIASASRSQVHEDGRSFAAAVQEGGRTYHFRAKQEDTTIAQARLAWEADLMLIAVEASKLAMPIHRENVQMAGPMHVPDIAVVFTNSAQVSDPELLELGELEMRELLDMYQMGGADALCASDDAEAQTSAPGESICGPLAIVRALPPFIRKRAADAPAWESQRVSARVNVLQQVAVFPPEVAMTIQRGPAAVLMSGEAHNVEVVTARPINPGGGGKVEIVFDAPVPLVERQHFAVLNKGHITATGVVMENR